MKTERQHGVFSGDGAARIQSESGQHTSSDVTRDRQKWTDFFIMCGA